MKSTAWVITGPSIGKYDAGILRKEEHELPELKTGEVLLKTIYLSIDPSNRNALTLIPGTAPQPLVVGDVMLGQGVSVVEESADDAFKPGDIVSGLAPWADFSIVSATDINLAKLGLPLETNMSIFSHVGHAATGGMIGVGNVKETDTVIVSAAAGATGSLAGQIGKAMGARVIGIAGGSDKCSYVMDELGFDGVVDYKAEDVTAALAELCPEGASLYFENVGGAILDAVLMNLAFGAKIAVCGQIALYNSDDRMDGQGVRNLMQLVFRNITMQGFFAGYPYDKAEEYDALLTRLYTEGKLKARTHIIQGLDQAPESLNMVLTGGNKGKLMVQVSEEPSV